MAIQVSCVTHHVRARLIHTGGSSEHLKMLCDAKAEFVRDAAHASDQLKGAT